MRKSQRLQVQKERRGESGTSGGRKAGQEIKEGKTEQGEGKSTKRIKRHDKEGTKGVIKGGKQKEKK